MHHARATIVQFVPDGELAVRHLPTGNLYTTYPASSPDDFYVLCRRGSAGEWTNAEQLYDLAELREAARPMLEQLLRHRRSLTVISRL